MSVFVVILVRIQSDCGIIRNRKNPNMDTFHPVICLEVKFSNSVWLAFLAYRSPHENSKQQFLKGLSNSLNKATRTCDWCLNIDTINNRKYSTTLHIKYIGGGKGGIEGFSYGRQNLYIVHWGNNIFFRIFLMCYDIFF